MAVGIQIHSAFVKSNVSAYTFLKSSQPNFVFFFFPHKEFRITSRYPIGAYFWRAICAGRTARPLRFLCAMVYAAGLHKEEGCGDHVDLDVTLPPLLPAAQVQRRFVSLAIYRCQTEFAWDQELTLNPRHRSLKGSVSVIV